ncbi:MAG: DUF4926 domain-containing protein, partial [Cyanobacteria bacterium SW_11_48_12]
PDGEVLALVCLKADQFIVVWKAKTKTWLSISEQVASLIAHLPKKN